ncbi:hypothetical protein A7D25_23420 [Pseudomonas sp. 21C1]|nr:hypothetical protein A7D25_23420 [Pseudomonas sp. 21C1]
MQPLGKSAVNPDSGSDFGVFLQSRYAHMRKILITPNCLTGDILEAFHRQYLDGNDLASWSEELLIAGFNSDAIIEAMSNPEMHWPEVPVLFSKICSDIGLSTDVINEIESLKLSTMLEEYRHGYRQALQILQRFEELRVNIGFPEPIEFRLMEDSPNGKNESGYYGIQSKKSGNELEELACKHLDKLNI